MATGNADQAAICIAAVILVLLIILVFALTRRKGGKKGGFASGSPRAAAEASEHISGAVAAVCRDLDRIAAGADDLDLLAVELGDQGGGDCAEARALLAGVRGGMVGTLGCVRGLRAQQRTRAGDRLMNAHGLYQGLRTADYALWQAGQTYYTAGARMRDLAAPKATCAGGGATLGQAQAAGYAKAGEMILNAGGHYYDLARSVHYLGWALGLE